MSDLVVVAFDHFDDARAALRSLRALESDGRVAFEDTALVQRDPDGTAHIRNEVSGTTETGAVIGGIAGAILSFAVPIAGVVIGAAAGAAVGASLGRGVSGDFVKEVSETLRPGRSALLLVVKRADMELLIAALRQFRGDVVQTTLPDEAERALRAALD